MFLCFLRRMNTNVIATSTQGKLVRIGKEEYVGEKQPDKKVDDANEEFGSSVHRTLDDKRDIVGSPAYR